MKRNTTKYQYPQLDTYKELLELAHLKRKTIIINMIIVALSMIVLYFLIQIDYNIDTILLIMLEFGIAEGGSITFIIAPRVDRV